MDALNIESAVIMPLNDPWLMSMEFTISAVHKNLYKMKQRYPGKFYASADIDTRNAPAVSVEAIRQAIDEYSLDGIKIHPNNTGFAWDSDYNQAIHSYPKSVDDPSAAMRIVKMLEQYPKLIIIISHMGAYQWEQLLSDHAYMDYCGRQNRCYR